MKWMRWAWLLVDQTGRLQILELLVREGLPMTKILETPLTYSAENKRYLGLLLQDAGQAPTAVVVLLPDWRGQSALARDHAGFLVERGCAVVIADLYGEGFSPTDINQVGAMVKQLIDQREGGVKALRACVEATHARLPAALPVYCLGYSAGGMVALDYARSGAEIAGVITCSALLKTAAVGMSTRIAAPVLILQGTRDAVSPMEVISAVVREMDEAGNDFRFELYGQTHHAFDNPEAGTDPTARLVYSPSSAARAKAAIAAFIADSSRKR